MGSASARMPHGAAILIVIAATFVWGTSFPLSQFVLKTGLNVGMMLAVRFGLGTVAILLLLAPMRVRVTRRALGEGAILGLVVAGAFWLQMDGLRITTVPKSGFITGLFVLFTPICALLFGERVKLHHGAAALISVVGLYGLVYGGGPAASGGWNRGDGETLVGAVLFGVQIYLIGRFSRQSNGVVLALGQVGTTALIWGAASLLMPGSGRILAGLGSGDLMVLAYLGIVATGIVVAAQCVVQASLGPAEAAILFTLEPFFAALLAVCAVVPGVSAHLAPLQWAGAALLLAAPVLTEQGDALFARRRRRPRP